jgi:hypothetical protein
MIMENVFSLAQPNTSTRFTLKKTIAISTVLLLLQMFTITPRANANVISESYGAFSVGTAMAIGFNACSYPCSALATVTMVSINNYAPVVANKAVEYAKPGLVEMFTNWGSTFFRP